VQVVLERLRRGVAAQGQARRGFTVARTEALLRLRDLPRAPWAWTLGLVRAARLLSTSGRAVVLEVEEGDERVVTLRFGVGGRDLAGAELRSILHAAVAGPEDRLMTEEGWLGELGERWRAEVGAAINAGLAAGPRSIALHTASAGRMYLRRDSQTAGQDSYAEQPASGRCPVQAFEVVVREPRPSVGRRLTAWLARQSGAAPQIEKLWREALFLPAGQAGAVELGRALPGYRVALGEHAVWGAVAGLGGPWLVREGVRALSLAPALAAAGLQIEPLSGWIECAALRLTADEGAVVQDLAFELLVAWLHDARAHVVAGTSGQGGKDRVEGTGASGQVGKDRVEETGALGQGGKDRVEETGASGHVDKDMGGGTGETVGREGDGQTWTVVWPTRIEQVPTASERAVDRETISQRARLGRDFLYVWRHQQGQVPTAMQARTFTLWPSELAALIAAVPELRPVPVRALGDSPQVERVDLTSLAQGSLAPVMVDLGTARTAMTAAGVRIELSLQAFVHRYPTAGQGATVLLAYGRRVANVREAARVVPGVTLVCEVIGADIDALRGELAVLQMVTDRCRDVALEAMPMLLAQGLAHATPWEVPLVRTQAEALTGAALGLRYRSERGEAPPVLVWEESPLLGLAIGRDATGTQAVTLQQALERCRDAGGIAVLVAGQAWPGWVAREPMHAPWTLTPEGRALLERVTGKDVLWDMPTLPELHALPRERSAQPGLLQTPGELQRLRARGDDERNRPVLLAHLLAARASGQGVAELEELPLLRRYDPRALTPLRKVSLAAVLAEAPLPGLLIAGAATRTLGGPVVLVTPGEAWLLHEAGLRPASASSVAPAPMPMPGHARPQRRAGGVDVPLLVVPVASAVAVGALRIEGPEPRKVALWSGGLHIDDVELPAPLECVGGRLILTRQGTRSSGDRLGGEIRGLCRIVVSQALEQRRLHRPGGPQQVGLGEFVANCQRAIAAGQGALIADLLAQKPGPEGERLGVRLAVSLQRHPLTRLPPPGPKRLEAVLRQVLARPLAVGSALLSWQAASLRGLADTGAGWEIDLGRRNAFVQRALAAEQGPEDVYLAAALALAGLFSAARERRAPASALVDEWVADYRLLALVYAHAP